MLDHWNQGLFLCIRDHIDSLVKYDGARGVPPIGLPGVRIKAYPSNPFGAPCTYL